MGLVQGARYSGNRASVLQNPFLLHASWDLAKTLELYKSLQPISSMYPLVRRRVGSCPSPISNPLLSQKTHATHNKLYCRGPATTAVLAPVTSLEPSIGQVLGVLPMRLCPLLPNSDQLIPLLFCCHSCIYIRVLAAQLYPSQHSYQDCAKQRHFVHTCSSQAYL